MFIHLWSAYYVATTILDITYKAVNKTEQSRSGEKVQVRRKVRDYKWYGENQFLKSREGGDMAEGEELQC